MKHATDSPLPAAKIDDIVAKPTDKTDDESKDEVSEMGSVAEHGDVDDSGWDDDSSEELHSKTPEPTSTPLKKILENNGKIIDWAIESTTKLSGKMVEPTGKPTDWAAQTERTESKNPQIKTVVEIQDASLRFGGRTANRLVMPTQKTRLGYGDYEHDYEYSNDYQSDFGFGNDGSTKVLTKTWISIDNLNVLFDEGTLNLTGLGLSGM